MAKNTTSKDKTKKSGSYKISKNGKSGDYAKSNNSNGADSEMSESDRLLMRAWKKTYENRHKRLD